MPHAIPITDDEIDPRSMKACSFSARDRFAMSKSLWGMWWTQAKSAPNARLPVKMWKLSSRSDSSISDQSGSQ